MKRYFLLFLLIFSPVTVLFAQDTIYFTNGSTQLVKVLEIRQAEISYVRYDNMNGPNYIVSRRQVEKIVYQNGVSEFFTESKSPPARSEGKSPEAWNPRMEVFARNLVAINYMDFLFKRVMLSAERLLDKNGLFGVQLSFAAGLDYTELSRTANTIWETSLSGHIYPFYQRKVTYYLGPLLALGEARESLYARYPSPYYPGYYYNVYEKVPRYYFSGYMIHGLRLNPIKNFGFSFEVGIGLRYNDIDHSTAPSALIRGNIHFAF